jgi:hypothetical protein
VPFRVRRPWTATILTVIVLAALIGGAVYLGNRAHHGTGRPAQAAPSTQLTAVGLCQSCAHGFNPLGDPVNEHPNASLAIDNDPTTAWNTQTYVSAKLGKAGTGIYVDASPRTTAGTTARVLQILTVTPGWKATIYARHDAPPIKWPDAGWTQVAPPMTIANQQRIQLSASTTPYRYFLVWITDLGGHGSVAINELTLYR